MTLRAEWVLTQGLVGWFWVLRQTKPSSPLLVPLPFAPHTCQAAVPGLEIPQWQQEGTLETNQPSGFQMGRETPVPQVLWQLELVIHLHFRWGRSSVAKNTNSKLLFLLTHRQESRG